MKAQILNLLDKFSSLQRKLISELSQKFSISENLDDHFVLGKIDRSGELEIDNVVWSYQRHGAGFRFTNILDNTEIDAHKFIGSLPQAFDPYRVEIFLRSSGLKEFLYEDIKFVADIKSLEKCFKDLEKKHILKEIRNSHYILDT